jgi:hypothetical protein
MFGLLLAGRLVDTGFRTIDESHVVIDIDHVETVNHVVVFLTGQTPFPDGMGGAVYFSWPQEDPNNPPSWQFLGSLSNVKPSAIFKIGRTKQMGSGDSGQSVIANRFGGGSGVNNVIANAPKKAQLGISMEPMSQLAGMTPNAQNEASSAPTFLEFSQKMVENLFNFTSSFAVSAAQVQGRPNETFIPFSALQQWYSNFERRLSVNPFFWK